MSTRAIQNLERGERHPYADTTARLLAALGLRGQDRASFETAARPQPRRTTGTPARSFAGGHNLPAPITACIGRATQLSEVLRSLETGRLTTLVGFGGAGKTRLALQVAHEVVNQQDGLNADGVWLVELGALADPSLVGQAVASVFGVREEPARPLLATLVDALRARHLVLVLDNCEHLLTASAILVDALLAGCPYLRVLATSRQPLGLPGEQVRQVPPLTLEFAVELFVERAFAAAPDFRMSPAIADDVDRICRQLDGMPLALELAAARLRALTPGQLAGHLTQPLRLLTGRQTASARHQSLRGAIDWSYQLLDSRERALLRKLSVFAGGWTLAAVESVCGVDAADDLWRLVDQSLITVDWRDGSEPRYALLETVRSFAFEKLEEAGEAAPTRARHVSFFLGFAERAEWGLAGAELVAWLAQLDVELANLRVALGWAIASHEAESAMRLAAALGPYWELRGQRTEAIGWLGNALAVPGPHTAEVRSRALCAAGRQAVGSENDRAAVWLRESLSLARHAGSPAAEARALVELGRMHVDRGSFAEADDALEQAHTLAVLQGDDLLSAATLDLLGQCALDQTRYAVALPRLEASLDQFRRLGDRSGLAATLRHVAMARLELGEIGRARAPVEEAMWLLRELGDSVGVAWALHDLGRLALESDAPERAADLFDDSLRLFRRFGQIAGTAWTVHSLGRVYMALGDVRRAEEYFDDGLELFRQVGLDRGVAWAYYNLAWVAAEQQLEDRAAELVTAAQTLFESIELGPGIAACLVLRARLDIAENPRAAAQVLGRAAALGGPIATHDRVRALHVERTARGLLGDAEFEVRFSTGQQRAVESALGHG